ncbi:YdeI/OmpD-associated family protein [Nocardia sp. NPDC052001]|uniref:YdeI/OmpD-associated family protein n=1 Tax=Nocardia sp. NPDC052001 TaxID=3154853 RepID=UPI00341C1F91
MAGEYPAYSRAPRIACAHAPIRGRDPRSHRRRRVYPHSRRRYRGARRWGPYPVRATFDGIAYTGSIMSMGDGPCLGILKGIRAELGKAPGDTVTVTVRRDTAERTVEVPDDLAAALADAGVRDAFDGLSYTNRRELATGVAEAKRPETRAKRITKAVDAARERGR